MSVILDHAGNPVLDPDERDGLRLETKKKKQIPNYMPPEEPPARLDAFKSAHAGFGRDLRSLSATYNCVGLVFAARRTWIDDCHIRSILEQDGYKRVPEKDVCVGDVVVYTKDDGTAVHVGIVWSIPKNGPGLSEPMKILSKWGRAGEYIHNPENVQRELGRPTEFWSDRVNV